MTSADAARLALGLTCARLLAGPVIATLLLIAASAAGGGSELRFAALGIFLTAALTDVADGWIARRFGAVTVLGAAMDHAADKVLTSLTLVALAATILPNHLILVAALLIGRDFLVAGLREGLALSGRALPVDSLGKWKAAVLMVGLVSGLLETALLAWPPSGLADAAYLITHAGLIGALALSLWGAGVYVLLALRQEAADTPPQ